MKAPTYLLADVMMRGGAGSDEGWLPSSQNRFLARRWETRRPFLPGRRSIRHLARILRTGSLPLPFPPVAEPLGGSSLSTARYSNGTFKLRSLPLSSSAVAAASGERVLVHSGSATNEMFIP